MSRQGPESATEKLFRLPYPFAWSPRSPLPLTQFGFSPPSLHIALYFLRPELGPLAFFHRSSLHPVILFRDPLISPTPLSHSKACYLCLSLFKRLKFTHSFQLLEHSKILSDSYQCSGVLKHFYFCSSRGQSDIKTRFSPVKFLFKLRLKPD